LDINLEPRRLQEYTQIAMFYPSECRYLYENLTWTHYRDAMRTHKDDLVGALDMLDRASDLGLTTNTFREYLQENQKDDLYAVKSGLRKAIAIIRTLEPTHTEIEGLEKILTHCKGAKTHEQTHEVVKNTH